MTPEQIKQGHFYRFRGSSTVLGMLSEWPGTDKFDRELEYVSIHHNGVSDETRRQSAVQLAAWCSCEVTPTWTDVVIAELAPLREIGRSCKDRGHHDFPSSLPEATCKDCGISLPDAVRAQHECAAAEAAAEEAAEKAPEPAPDPDSVAAAFAASLLGD